uniref:Protein-lysine N-methyltransferase n=1 Tax=Pinguiococcus pyrenoidosus TaxID=172671 RepID=A0A7R9YEY6_9STRA
MDDEDKQIGVEELSAETLAALQAFLHSKDEANGVTEDFGLSQFWYTDETAQTLAQAVMNIADEAANAADGGDDEGGIAILCSPTCLKGMRDTPEGRSRKNVKILEYDRRFGETYPEEFVFYDVYDVEGLLREHPEMEHAYDAILADPPYTESETVVATLEGMRRMAKLPITPKDANGVPGVDFTPCVFVSALLSRDIFRDFGFRPTTYRLSFSSKFATPMYTYTNFEPLETFPLGSWLEDGEIGDQQNAIVQQQTA